jgi:aspartyl-tRNA(Asn)/glutamyl-tRNA(Gln) amidotransferase subunit A
MNDPGEWSLCTAMHALAAGHVSRRELVEASLARIEHWQPRINAFVRLEADAARAEATRRDRLPAPVPRPALDGAVLAHKDMFERAGRVATHGSRTSGATASARTATLLGRLDAAAAIELGTLNMAEFALGPTGHNEAHGDCRNPWHPAHVAGGSSSGSGAAVAARLVHAALGSDSGGSVRLPASANGVLGLKPTHGLLSRHGMMPLSPSIDVPGVFARHARDLARVLDVLAGHDPADPRSSRRPVPDHEAALAEPATVLRIGVPDAYFYEELDADVEAALDAARGELRRSGLGIAAVVTPGFVPQLAELSRALVYAEASAVHGVRLARGMQSYAAQTRVRAATGLAIPAPVYVQALQLRGELLRRFVSTCLADCDALLLPTLACTVPTLADTAVGAGEALWRRIAPLVRCTAPFNYLGLPALSVPCGFDRRGLPIGLQLVGRPFAERTLLRLAAAYQSTTDWHLRSPRI